MIYQSKRDKIQNDYMAQGQVVERNQRKLNMPIQDECQILKFCKVIEVTRFGTVIQRVRSQGKGIASLDGSDGNAASTY